MGLLAIVRELVRVEEKRHAAERAEAERFLARPRETAGIASQDPERPAGMSLLALRGAQAARRSRG